MSVTSSVYILAKSTLFKLIIYSNKIAPFVKKTFPFSVAIYKSYKSSPLNSLLFEEVLEYKRTDPSWSLDISVALPTPEGTSLDLTTLIVETLATLISEFKNLGPISIKHASASSLKATFKHSWLI